MLKDVAVPIRSHQDLDEIVAFGSLATDWGDDAIGDGTKKPDWVAGCHRVDQATTGGLMLQVVDGVVFCLIPNCNVFTMLGRMNSRDLLPSG
jgi:hypothetical protein